MADRLILSARVHAELRAEATRAVPFECCGVLAGRDGRVTAVYAVPNAAEERLTRYEIDPAELWAARRRAHDEGLEVVGFYHSHPRTPPVPSSYDVERAYYPDAIYAIAGLVPAFEVRAFRIGNGLVSQVGLEIEE